MEVLGFDIGGSGIKGAVVDTKTGELISERIRYPTPQYGEPEAVIEVFNRIISELEYEGPVGYGFPCLIKHGKVLFAANIDKAWEGKMIMDYIQKGTDLPAYVLNDADSAGLAEMKFGVGRKYQEDVVLLLTLGTGIGTVFFVEGKMFPNTELGHLTIRGKDAEHRASNAVREDKNLSWKKWAKRFQEYLDEIERLFSPDAIIIGGGMSKKSDKYFPLLKTRADLITAQMKNEAGIIGAAAFAESKHFAKK